MCYLHLAGLKGKEMKTGSTVCCQWCGISLGNEAVTYLNGTMACCDLCLMKANIVKTLCWCGGLHPASQHPVGG